MKRLFLVIAAAALGYSAFWFISANSLRNSVEAWFEDQREDGWEATYSDIAVRGFPSRTDLTLSDIVLRSPDGNIGWQAPFFQILGLSYKRGHVIVAWPDTQTFTTPEGNIDVASDGLRASVIYDDDLILRSNLEAEVLNITGPDQTLALAGINIALEKIEPAPAEYRLAATIDGIAVSDPAITGNLAPNSLATLRTDTIAKLDAPLTLDNFTNDTPPLNGLTIRNTQVNYGALTLKLAGDTEFDAQGRATGEVTIEAANWRESLQTAQTNGDLPPELSKGFIELLGMVASLSGGRETLDVTLGLNHGDVLLGPFPVGQLPPLRWP